ncbi:hypothetical protein C7974DRAFT_99309 [Boeremia exigua]|uniref:uncharacterized protein n=1 Tax=Boeremia exigua TaxID=749465 RepID=UPI001E8D79DC|nr:uncharacterized protein C7974DRAFT_99309 [Boeremia exigua]KAH6642320.1 hypothetical protein C7974DRAFT_99309 [Boeremia exigua]
MSGLPLQRVGAVIGKWDGDMVRSVLKTKHCLPLIVHATSPPHILVLLSAFEHLLHHLFSQASHFRSITVISVVKLPTLFWESAIISSLVHHDTTQKQNISEGLQQSIYKMFAAPTVPDAPAAVPSSPSGDGWSPLAIIGIVAAIMVLLLCVPLIAILLRRYERKRCKELVKDSGSRGSSRGSDGLSRLEEGQSLRSILVTRELQRVSLKLSKPEEAHVQGRGWSDTEVRGGRWRV